MALALAAFLGSVGWVVRGADLGAFVGAVGFSFALVIETYLLKTRPDRAWYDGRAVAESVKTLAWRYSVGGSPFGRNDGSHSKIEMRLLDRFKDVVGSVSGSSVIPADQSGEQITPAMRDARAASLSDRRRLYEVGRLEDQQVWYTAQAKFNEKRSSQWSIVLVTAEIGGIAGAVAKASGLVSVDVAGLAAALVAGAVAWTQARQHNTLSSAYSVAAHELGDVRTRAKYAMSEADWADFVDHAEEAISREHTLWRASRR